MQTFSLQSGSHGNAIFVEAGGVRLIFDAGISAKLAQQRMAVHGRSMEDVDALFISHDHSDHIRCAGVYNRKFDIPLYVTQETLQTRRAQLGTLDDVRHFQAGDSLELGTVRVHTIATPHDAVDGVAFVIEHDGKRLAILTDLGHPQSWMQRVLESVDAAYLEHNYDPEMLEQGPYPYHLKRRIQGNGGHLSNQDAAELLRACGRHRPKWVAVSHLSAENNRPELAVEATRLVVGRDYPVNLAPMDNSSELFEV